MLNETLAPFTDGGFRPAQPAGDARFTFALGGPQHQLGASHQGVRESAGVGKTTQLTTLVVGQGKRGFGQTVIMPHSLP
jgi:hypothetical protein